MYDPGRKCAAIKPVYDALKQQLPELIGKILKKQSKEAVLPLTNKISIEQQKAIGKRIMEVMGFDFNKGRLDVSAHPFCGGTHNDIRLTARYNENNFLSGLLAIIHETGHGLYELNLPNEYKSQPVGNAKGMAFHESQSLVMEMQASKSQEFIEFLAKLLRDEFALTGAEYSSDNLYKLSTRVSPSFIRGDADEATYPLHVILRFEIEQELIEGLLTVDDIPECWNLKMQEYLGIKPSSYSEGCLQDIHWPSGSFGYFPAYTNGAIIASMLMKKAKEENPNTLTELKDGNFTSLNLFLTNNLRSFGSLYQSAELLKVSTGHSDVQPEIFINYLSQKYL
jgi:carboxypeptidase Taq